jgi:hypothetical protein
MDGKEPVELQAQGVVQRPTFLRKQLLIGEALVDDCE